MLTLFALLPLGLLGCGDRRDRRGVVVGFLNFLAPLAIGGVAKLVGAIKGNKDKSKAQQQAYDTEKQNFELYEKPKLEKAARTSDLKATLRSAIARSYGIDKALPGFFDTPSARSTVANPYDTMKRPGGFSWGGLAADALGTVAEGLTSYQKNKELTKAFPDPADRARVSSGIPLPSMSRSRVPYSSEDFMPPFDWPASTPIKR